MIGDLVVRTAKPLCAEMPLAAQVGTITASSRFFVRNHFPVPRVDPASWALSVGGLVRQQLKLSLADIRRLPSRSLVVTVECAGNGRAMLDPRVEGEQWQLGAVSTAEWTGVPLVEVLDRAAVRDTAREVVFSALDRASARSKSPVQSFERSLPLDVAQTAGPLLAYAMNGEPLPPNHGFPLRLVVPGWYGMASIKWLGEIRVVDQPFDGYFQTDRYVIEREGSGGVTTEPLTRVRVRSIVTEPQRGDVMRPGKLLVRGYAWSGSGDVERVEVDTGGGWHVARLLDDPQPYAWRRWELTTRLERPGRTMIRARATDTNGNTQPERSASNRLGYANNAVQVVPIEVFE